jgi:hypothetical protein
MEYKLPHEPFFFFGLNCLILLNYNYYESVEKKNISKLFIVNFHIDLYSHFYYLLQFFIVDYLNSFIIVLELDSA